jgi:hypothetical protein
MLEGCVQIVCRMLCAFKGMVVGVWHGLGKY